MILKSPLLSQLPGLLHGFSTRLGGTSEGTRATLDLGTGPDTLENRRRFADMVGLPGPQALIQVEQVHGAELKTLQRPEDLEAIAGAKADGLIALPGAGHIAVGVRTADCAPVLIAGLDAAARPVAVAAVHAGWRGAVQGIVPKAAQALRALGAEQLRVSIGPTIGVQRFEVGDEVIEAAASALGEAPPMIQGPKKKHLDLVGFIRAQLQKEGIEQVDHVGGCTYDNPALFFSYRRDQGGMGRLLSVLGFSK